MGFPVLLESFGNFTTDELNTVMAMWPAPDSGGVPGVGEEPLGYVLKWHRVLGTCSIEGPGLHGDSFLRTVGSGSTVGCFHLAVFGVPIQVMRLGVRIRVSEAPPPGTLVRLVTARSRLQMNVRPGALRLCVDVDTDGFLHVNATAGAYGDLVSPAPDALDPSAGLVSSHPITFGVWQYLEMVAIVRPAADGGQMALRVDGAPRGTWTNVDICLDPDGRRTDGQTYRLATDYFQLGGDPDDPRDPYDTVVDYDDLYLGDEQNYFVPHESTAEWVPRWYGDVHVQPLRVTGSGSLEDTGLLPEYRVVVVGASSPWEALQEVPSDGDTSYVTNTIGYPGTAFQAPGDPSLPTLQPSLFNTLRVGDLAPTGAPPAAVPFQPVAMQMAMGVMPWAWFGTVEGWSWTPPDGTVFHHWQRARWDSWWATSEAEETLVHSFSGLFFQTPHLALPDGLQAGSALSTVAAFAALEFGWYVEADPQETYHLSQLVLDVLTAPPTATGRAPWVAWFG